MMPIFERLVAIGGQLYGGGTTGNFWDSAATLSYMYLHIVRAYFEKPPFFAPKQTPMALGQWLIGLKGVPIARANPYGLLASSEAMAVAITGS